MFKLIYLRFLITTQQIVSIKIYFIIAFSFTKRPESQPAEITMPPLNLKDLNNEDPSNKITKPQEYVSVNKVLLSNNQDKQEQKAPLTLPSTTFPLRQHTQQPTTIMKPPENNKIQDKQSTAITSFLLNTQFSDAEHPVNFSRPKINMTDISQYLWKKDEPNHEEKLSSSINSTQHSVGQPGRELRTEKENLIIEYIKGRDLNSMSKQPFGSLKIKERIPANSKKSTKMLFKIYYIDYAEELNCSEVCEEFELNVVTPVKIPDLIEMIVKSIDLQVYPFWNAYKGNHIVRAEDLKQFLSLGFSDLAIEKNKHDNESDHANYYNYEDKIEDSLKGSSNIIELICRLGGKSFYEKLIESDAKYYQVLSQNLSQSVNNRRSSQNLKVSNVDINKTIYQINFDGPDEDISIELCYACKDPVIVDYYNLTSTMLEDLSKDFKSIILSCKFAIVEFTSYINVLNIDFSNLVISSDKVGLLDDSDEATIVELRDKPAYIMILNFKLQSILNELLKIGLVNPNLEVYSRKMYEEGKKFADDYVNELRKKSNCNSVIKSYHITIVSRNLKDDSKSLHLTLVVPDFAKLNVFEYV